MARLTLAQARLLACYTRAAVGRIRARVRWEDANVARVAIVARALANPEARARFNRSVGEAFSVPLRRNLDYQGMARRTFLVEQLPPGALATYDRDIDVAAIVVTGAGNEANNGTYVLSSNPEATTSLTL